MFFKDRYKKLKALARQIRVDVRRKAPASFSFFGKVSWKVTLLFNRYGWKLVVGIFVYYLIRDSVLYLFIPLLIAKKFFD